MRGRLVASGLVAAATLVCSAPVVAAPPSRPSPVDLDAMFIGAHPDDEAFTLSTFGQWDEYAGVRTGVITVTRGEGGGNAVGPEEGPALGLLREAEERRAVGRAGIRSIYNLDRVDFYYTVSSPLTEQIWGRQETLARIVRVLRQTRPEVVVTMNPSPTPGNHGNHQYAARLAIEAYFAAADPRAFPEQLAREGLRPWRVKRLFRGGAAEAPATPGTPPSTGPTCARTFVPAAPTDDVFSVWSGTPSARNGGTSWAQVEREAQREYVSQGWGGFPDMPTDPARLGCDRFTQIASRVPFRRGATSTTAMLEGALVRAPGGLPLGTELQLEASQFDITAGTPFTLTVRVRAGERALRDARVALAVPTGWRAGRARLGTVAPGREVTARLTVTPAADAATGRVSLAAALRSGGRVGRTTLVTQVVPAVSGTLQRLPQVSQFEAWTRELGVRQLGGIVRPVLAIGLGETRAVRIDVRNNARTAQSGTVALTLPAGFAADAPSKPYTALAPGATTSVSFAVTNTDPALPLPNADRPADIPFDIVTTSEGGSSTENAGINLVPVTTVPQAAAAPAVDGVEGPGEYGGSPLDLTPRWEGQACTSAADCSGSAKVTWSDDALYLHVKVTDDILGTVLTPADCKRHWRTDSVEIALDPRGTSENTSTTFKTGIFPVTDDPANGNPPCFQRDADNRQGPGAQTAPGMEVRSVVSSPYTGYTLEVKIPLGLLPAAVDPARLGLNIFIYDSDTQDKTGQTRLGWSNFNGVQGDPYRWGHATLAGYTPPADRPTTPTTAVIPSTALPSLESPQSILQAAWDGVALAGERHARRQHSAWFSASPRVTSRGVGMRIATGGRGTLHVFVWAGGRAVASRTVAVSGPSNRRITVPLPGEGWASVGADTLVLVGWQARSGGTTAFASLVRP